LHKLTLLKSRVTSVGFRQGQFHRTLGRQRRARAGQQSRGQEQRNGRHVTQNEGSVILHAKTGQGRKPSHTELEIIAYKPWRKHSAQQSGLQNGGSGTFTLLIRRLLHLILLSPLDSLVSIPAVSSQGRLACLAAALPACTCQPPGASAGAFPSSV
jgi:hypothetical protein